MRVLLFLIPLLANAAYAEETGDIPPEDWRSLALGRTLTYKVDGQFFALERYDASSNRVAIQMANGQCYTGHWSHSENAYCFHWGADPVCFRHVAAGDRILILELNNGQETGDVQEMTGISDTPLSCGSPMS